MCTVCLGSSGTPACLRVGWGSGQRTWLEDWGWTGRVQFTELRSLFWRHLKRHKKFFRGEWYDHIVSESWLRQRCGGWLELRTNYKLGDPELVKKLGSGVWQIKVQSPAAALDSWVSQGEVLNLSFFICKTETVLKHHYDWERRCPQKAQQSA